MWKEGPTDKGTSLLWCRVSATESTMRLYHLFWLVFFFKRIRLENEKKSLEKDSQEANFDVEEKEKTEKNKEESKEKKTEEKGLMEEGKTSSILREAEYTNVEGRRYR